MSQENEYFSQNSNETLNILAYNFGLLRKLKKIDIKEFCSILDVPREEYENYENAVEMPDFKIVAKIGTFYGIDPKELYNPLNDDGTVKEKLVNAAPFMPFNNPAQYGYDMNYNQNDYNQDEGNMGQVDGSNQVPLRNTLKQKNVLIKTSIMIIILSAINIIGFFLPLSSFNLLAVTNANSIFGYIFAAQEYLLIFYLVLMIWNVLDNILTITLKNSNKISKYIKISNIIKVFTIILESILFITLTSLLSFAGLIVFGFILMIIVVLKFRYVIK